MQLHHGTLYWPATTTPFVAEKINEPCSHYDVVIIGAGMSGALTAHYLMQQGLTVAVLDKRNGTVYSMMGAKMLAALLQGATPEGASIVALEGRMG